MFPFGLYLTGALVVLILFGVVDPRKIGIPRIPAALVAAALFAGYFFPPAVIGDWEINVAGMLIPALFGAVLLLKAKSADALIAFGASALAVWAATRVEAYRFGWLLAISALAAAALTAIIWFASDRKDVRGALGGLCLGAVVGEVLRCWTELRRDGVLITECGMGRYFDILLLAFCGIALLLPLLRGRRIRSPQR